MSERTIGARIVHKHDVEANWLKATNFIPKLGELIVYDKDDTYAYTRFKIGDGTSFVNSLPFIVHNPIWAGTTSEYNTANVAGLIPVGTIVFITDEEGTDSSDATTAMLGYAILGQMILG